VFLCCLLFFISFVSGLAFFSCLSFSSLFLSILRYLVSFPFLSCTGLRAGGGADRIFFNPFCSILLPAGEIFYERVTVDANGLRKYPDAADVAAHAKLIAVSIGETSTPPRCQPGLANEFVSVVTGPLFTSRSEFHLQSQMTWLMPRTSDAEACAAAVAHWRNTAPFHGIPFRANLTKDEIQLALQTLGATKRIAVTVLPTRKMDREPAILLIGVDPVVLATAVNCSSMVGDDWKPELPGALAGPKPTHGKFGYVFKWSDIAHPSKNYEASAKPFQP
jgi:hypothetical protein